MGDLCKSGVFSIAEDCHVPGELHLDGDATRAKLFSRDEVNWSDTRDVLGVLHDATKVSLHSCVPMTGTEKRIQGEEQLHVGSLFPHYVLIGDAHVTSSENKITRVQFSVDDATTVFGDIRAFGKIPNAHVHLESLSKIDDGKRIGPIGSLPLLFYYTGNQEIFLTKTSVGTVSAGYHLHLPIPSDRGIHVDARIFLNIEFPEPQSLDQAVRAILDLVRFVEVIAGRPQNVLNVRAELTAETGSPNEWLEVYWSLAPRRNAEGEHDIPHFFDLPIRAAESREEFCRILSAWLIRNEEWRNSRIRFSASFAHQRRYGIDRLVGAANMFDILPESAFRKPEPVTPELAEAHQKAREIFRTLAPSDDRSSVLNALGRIGKLTLKKKVRNRVEIVMRSVGDLFPELDVVTDHAIDCRNYYVHGSPPKLDYSSGRRPLSFFTDALEFVYAASDLIDSTWNAHACIRRYTTMSHPFGRFRVDYLNELAALKALRRMGVASDTRGK